MWDLGTVPGELAPKGEVEINSPRSLRSGTSHLLLATSHPPLPTPDSPLNLDEVVQFPHFSFGAAVTVNNTGLTSDFRRFVRAPRLHE